MEPRNEQLIITGLTASQKRWLKKEAARKGMPMTVIVKGWIDEAMDKEVRQQKGVIYERA